MNNVGKRIFDLLKRKSKTINNTKHKCPICGKTEFSSENSFEICDYCGWEDDGYQEASPNLWGGPNLLSKNDYLKLYQETIKINQNFKSRIGKIEQLLRCDDDKEHNCPVCGKTTFKYLNSYDRCRYCGWIDNWVQENYPDYSNSSNELDLNTFIIKYNEIIKRNPQYEWALEFGEYDFTDEEKEFINNLHLEYKVNKVMTNEELNNLLLLFNEIKNEENKSIIDKIENKILFL
jgi:ribosomal protein L37AE/L43A